jgi:anthranilate synthase/aminodeoxychorismate synthase-like glutamine amidotransferase
MRILLLDNYDSFTYNLFDYLQQTGHACWVVRNDAISIDELENADFQAIVLSPGPKRPEEAGIMPALIAHFYRSKPMLGVCLGMQALGMFFGAKLVKAHVPMHGKTSLITHTLHPIFEDIPPQFEVMRYHSLVLESLEGTDLQAIASTEAGELMALQHSSLPLVGVQFHPESILTQYGMNMIQNWVSYAQQSIENHAINS